MTNVYMKDSLKRITAVILLAAATLLVALQCGSIAKKRKRQHFYVPTLPLRAIKCLPTASFVKSVESPKAAVDNKINASENAGIDVKNELTALFTDLYGLVGDVLSGSDADTGELEVRFKNIFDGLFKLDADTVKKPTQPPMACLKTTALWRLPPRCCGIIWIITTQTG